MDTWTLRKSFSKRGRVLSRVNYLSDVSEVSNPSNPSNPSSLLVITFVFSFVFTKTYLLLVKVFDGKEPVQAGK